MSRLPERINEEEDGDPPPPTRSGGGGSDSTPQNLRDERDATVEDEEDAYKQEILRLTAVGGAQLSHSNNQERGSVGSSSSRTAVISLVPATVLGETGSSSVATSTTLERPVSDSSLSVSESGAGGALSISAAQDASWSRNEGASTTRSVPDPASVKEERHVSRCSESASPSQAPPSSNHRSVSDIDDKLEADDNTRDDAEEGTDLESPSPAPPPSRSFLHRYAQVQEEVIKDATSPRMDGAGSCAALPPPPPMPTHVPIATASAVRVPSDEFIMVPRSSLMVVPSSLLDPNGTLVDAAPHLLVVPSRHFLDGSNEIDIDHRDDREVATAIPMDDATNDDEIRQLHETIASLQEQLVVQNELVKSLRQTLRSSAATNDTTVTTSTTTTSVATFSFGTATTSAGSNESTGDPIPASVGGDGSPRGGKSKSILYQQSFNRNVARRKRSKWMLIAAAALLLTAALILAIVLPMTSNSRAAPGGSESAGGSSIDVESPTPSPAEKVVGSKPSYVPVPTASPYPTIVPYPADLYPGGNQETLNNSTNSSNTDDAVSFGSPSPFSPSAPTVAPAADSDSKLSGSSTAALSAGAVAGISVAALVVASLILLYVAMARTSSDSRTSDDDSASKTKAAGPPSHRQVQGDEASTSRIHDDDLDGDEYDEADDASIDESYLPSALHGEGAADFASPSRLSVLQSKVVALQAKVTRRSEQAQQLVALLEQQRDHHQPRAPPQPAGELDIL